MKKFLLTLMILGVTASSTSAYYEVNYMNTGAVKNFTPVRFGQNAPIGSGPQHDEYNYNINLNVNNKVQPKQTTIGMTENATSQQTTTTKMSKTKAFSPISCNGVTYYNQNNPCSL